MICCGIWLCRVECRLLRYEVSIFCISFNNTFCIVLVNNFLLEFFGVFRVCSILLRISKAGLAEINCFGDYWRKEVIFHGVIVLLFVLYATADISNISYSDVSKFFPGIFKTLL